MSKLILVRHGLSVGNKKGIIQGNINFSLTKKGKEQISGIDISSWGKPNKILSSNMARTLESAKILKKNLGVDKFEIDDLLAEVNAGILNGQVKEYCEQELKEYYQIYRKRGDYDSIPFADNWTYTQARVLMFLEQYLNHESNDVIVSHAAFIRAMYNFIEFRYRNTPIMIDNASVHFVNDPFHNIEITDYEIARSSIVKKVSCYDNDYILKRKEKLLSEKDYTEKAILEYLNKYFEVPDIIAMSDRKSYSLKVYRYLHGMHKYGLLSSQNVENITKKVAEMHSCFLDYYSENIPTGNIELELRHFLSQTTEDEIKKVIEQLLTNETFMNYLSSASIVPIHNDLHRSNILIDGRNINIIDYEGVKKYPSLLQLASYIAVCFLLENSEYAKNQIINFWPFEIDYSIVNNLAVYRLLYGYAFFESRNESADEIDKNLKMKYLNGIRRNVKNV